jgi:hypothetical protein
MNDAKDRSVLRALAEQYMEVAALPVQKEKRRLWERLNGLTPERPMVMIDQLPWHELSAADTALAVQCADPALRRIEREMRRTLYQWAHFKADKVVEPYWPVLKVIEGPGYEHGWQNAFPGLAVKEETLTLDAGNDVVSHQYKDQLQTWEDLDAIGEPALVYNEAETLRRVHWLDSVFGDILPVKAEGHSAGFRVWDEIAMLRGITPILYDLADRPQFTHAIMEKATRNMISIKEQLVSLGAMAAAQPVVHCSGAYTDDLPAAGFDPRKPRAADAWSSGMAQLFSSVSTDMHDEFEIEYARRFYQGFGHVYYGCCEPLDTKLSIVKKIPNVRKVSMSPWTDPERAAPLLGDRYVYTAKPNPAFLAADTFDVSAAINEIKRIIACCKANHCPVEFILKDVSTIRYQSERLVIWEKAVMETVLS